MANLCPLMGGRRCLREDCMLFILEDDPNDDIQKNTCSIAVLAGASTSADGPAAPGECDCEPEEVIYY